MSRYFNFLDTQRGDVLFDSRSIAAMLAVGNVWFVNGATGNNTSGIGSSALPYQTISKALTVAASGDVISVAPGSYNETLTIPRSFGDGLTIIGQGNQGSIGLAPTTTNAGAVINDADDVTFINVGMAANGTGSALINTGARMRAFSCKLENDDGTGLCAQMTLGTVAQRDAHTKGGGADCLFSACEFAWAASGVKVTGTDYGALTELRIQGCRFHDLATSHILESVGSGGSAAVTYASLEIVGNTFGPDEAGAMPTKFILLNANNANSGLVTGNSFPTALNSTLNLVSTKLFWVGNFHPAGLSTAQPS